jgi:predicted SprT family Zn-dependent metalloprotease
VTHAEATPPDRAVLESRLERLCEEHGIAPVPRLEWSKRMRRMLGRAYVDRGMIRLSAWLSETQAMDTLRHELAHIAVGKTRRHGPHGPAWQEWAVRLGVEPRASARAAPEDAPSRRKGRRYWGLECPGCGLRLARARVLPGLYHRDCGPRKGRLARVLRDSRARVLAWCGPAESR